MKYALSLFCDDEGVTAIEYALVAGLIAVAIVGAVAAVGGSTQDMYERVSDTVVGVVGKL